MPYDRSQQRPLLGNLFQASLGRLSYNDRPGTPAAWTTALVSASAGGLQLAVECHEPRMDKLVATHRERDSDIWVDDCLEVFVQPPGQPYRHFIVNPLGTQFDELVRDARWNADWQATARRGEQSWAVDLTLPWAALGATPKLGDIWRFNLCRSRRPEPELSAWSPTAQGFHEPARFGELRFGAGPHVTSLDWRLETRRGGRLKVSWAPADAHVSLRLNGQPSDGTFSCPTEGLNELVFEAVSDGQAVLRLPLSVLVTPLGGAVDAVRRRLAAIAATPAKAAMTERLDSLAKLADSAPPDLAGDVLRQLQDLERQASHLAVGSACAKAGRPADGIAYGTEG